MQVRAIIEAACKLKKEGLEVVPEIMVPLISTVKELEIHTERHEDGSLSIVILSSGIDLESEEMRKEMLAVERADTVDDVLQADSGLALAYILFRSHNIKLDAFSNRSERKAGFTITIPVERVIK
jgi:hypothetical protein